MFLRGRLLKYLLQNYELYKYSINLEQTFEIREKMIPHLKLLELFIKLLSDFLFPKLHKNPLHIL